MWGDLLSSSQLTDEDFKRLASELESGRVIGTERFCNNVQCVNRYIPMGDTENYE